MTDPIIIPDPKYTAPERIDPPSELIDMDVGGCSCHINPPCSFCTTMTEQEADAYDQGGMDALHALWRAWEAAAIGEWPGGAA